MQLQTLPTVEVYLKDNNLAVINQEDFNKEIHRPVSEGKWPKEKTEQK